ESANPAPPVLGPPRVAPHVEAATTPGKPPPAALDGKTALVSLRNEAGAPVELHFDGFNGAPDEMISVATGAAFDVPMTVGDYPARIEETLRLAMERADLILTSGGLGPTQDDLTKECIASVFGEELVLDPPSLAALEKFFSMRRAPMPERNRKQALIYRGG